MIHYSSPIRLIKHAFVALMVWLPGCSPPVAEGVTATGSVIAGGQPLSGAFITLEPIDGTRGPNASVTVFDGQFVFSSKAGLQGGRYRVRIAMIPAEMRSQLPTEQVAKMPPNNVVVSPRYDANSEVACDLILGHDNRLNFEIEFLQ